MHLTLLKYPNTKTSLYKLSKNHWVIALFKKIGSVRKRLQSTVSLDHPVECNENIAKSTLSQQKISTSHISRRSFGEKSKCFWDYRNFPHSTDPEINIKNRNAHRILFAVGCLECELEILLELKLTQEMLEVRTSVRPNNNSRNVITFFAKKTFLTHT